MLSPSSPRELVKALVSRSRELRTLHKRLLDSRFICRHPKKRMTECQPTQRLPLLCTSNLLQYDLKKPGAQLNELTGPMLATWDRQTRASLPKSKSPDFSCPKLVVRKRLQVYFPRALHFEQSKLTMEERSVQ